MKFQFVTIEREYASGGQEIGSRLAKQLGIPCYGREILDIAARRYGVTADYLEHLEEADTSSFLYSLYMMSRPASPQSGLSDTGELALAEGKIIRELALQGPAVFVGRCAGEALKERQGVLNVFIHASPEFRRQRAEAEYGVEPREADAVLKAFDRRRSNYYNANTGRKWTDVSSYHLALNSGLLGLDRCVRMLEEAVKG